MAITISMMKNKPGFSQRHPFVFGFVLIVTAVVLFTGAMAVFLWWRSGQLTFGQERIGVVHVQGTISSARKINSWIDRLHRDESIKGLVVRINSPGGVVAPSQEIHAALKAVVPDKPVVVSMGSVAASGGYYIACAADRIVANPGTITGSIGVKAQLASFHQLMDKVGIKDQTVTSGDLKDAGSPTHPLTPKEKSYFQDLVDDLFDQFLKAVTQGRGLEPEKVSSIADGRAFTGRQAKELGLVDILGGMDRAVEEVQRMAGIRERVALVEGPKEDWSLWSMIFGRVREAGISLWQDDAWQFRYE